jgi:adenine-specific DNA methylase
VQEVTQVGERYRTILRKPESGDPIGDFTKTKVPRSLRRKIPRGVETRRLLANGFREWSDLYTARQISVLSGAIAMIKRLAVDQATKDRLALAVIGAAEMPAYISRWDRFHLKQFEGLANHRYSACGIAVESNVLAPVGRGTLSLRFKAASKAAKWAHETLHASPTVATCASAVRGRKPLKWNALITTGSSQKQVLPDRSVHLVLTDPPYHDDVQYGELAQLFHQWLAIYKPLESIDLSKEAVSNASRGSGTDTFEAIIAGCLSESHRTLHPRGRLVLTFHNKRIPAWQALAGALHAAGFSVSAIATVHSENGDDHCKRNVEAMLEDVVLECCKRSKSPISPRVTNLPRTVAEKNLVAMGLALATVVESGKPENIAAQYVTHLARLSGRKRLIV